MGKNPMADAQGMLNDIRDPRILSDRLLTLHATHTETQDTVMTLVSWSGHAEVGSGRDNTISADWIGVTRNAQERYEELPSFFRSHRRHAIGSIYAAAAGSRRRYVYL